MLSDDTRRRLAEARRRLVQLPADEDLDDSVSSIARDAGMTVSHFIRRFKAVFGETPHQLRIRQRTAWARRALALTDQSVTDICLDTGAASLATFSNQFRRRVAQSPSAYRREIRSALPDPAARRRHIAPSCMELMQLAWEQAEAEPDRDF